ncbi:MAG: hypothetical protein ACYTFY_20930 [Planctomycetota bacterium]|jgi:hypothetical protein
MNSAENKKMIVLGISCKCPFNQYAPDCPVKELRLLSVEERFEYINHLYPEEIDEIFKKHDICSRKHIL